MRPSVIHAMRMDDTSIDRPEWLSQATSPSFFPWKHIEQGPIPLLCTNGDGQTPFANMQDQGRTYESFQRYMARRERETEEVLQRASFEYGWKRPPNPRRRRVQEDKSSAVEVPMLLRPYSQPECLGGQGWIDGALETCAYVLSPGS